MRSTTTLPATDAPSMFGAADTSLGAGEAVLLPDPRPRPGEVLAPRGTVDPSPILPETEPSPILPDPGPAEPGPILPQTPTPGGPVEPQPVVPGEEPTPMDPEPDPGPVVPGGAVGATAPEAAAAVRAPWG